MFPPPDGSQMEWLFQDKCRGRGSNFRLLSYLPQFPVIGSCSYKHKALFGLKCVTVTRGQEEHVVPIPKTVFFHNIIWMSFEPLKHKLSLMFLTLNHALFSGAHCSKQIIVCALLIHNPQSWFKFSCFPTLRLSNESRLPLDDGPHTAEK